MEQVSATVAALLLNKFKVWVTRLVELIDTIGDAAVSAMKHGDTIKSLHRHFMREAMESLTLL